MTITDPATDPTMDLVLERELDVAPERVWAALTTPELITQWFAPRPFQVSDCEVDLRPGGIFRVVMCTAEGEVMDDAAGCILEVVEQRRLVWTAAMGPGFRPLSSDLAFTAVITLEPSGAGTRYHVVAVHGSPEARSSHEEMGFHQGWGTTIDQLAEVAKSL